MVDPVLGKDVAPVRFRVGAYGASHGRAPSLRNLVSGFDSLTRYMRFFSDKNRHLVCWPYSVENLHLMAKQLGIKRCWFHAGRNAHYDIPKLRIQEIAAKTEVMDSRTILAIIKGKEP